MSLRLKPIDEQVMVVFGASSGIGRATALLAAERGACVVDGFDKALRVELRTPACRCP